MPERPIERSSTRKGSPEPEDAANWALDQVGSILADIARTSPSHTDGMSERDRLIDQQKEKARCATTGSSSTPLEKERKRLNSPYFNISNEMLEEAIRQADRGHPVLPIHGISKGQCACPKKSDCSSPGKHPATGRGFKDATTDHETIKQWFSSSPSLNLASATGEISGLIAIDIDPRNDGDEGLAGLERLHGRLSDTVEVATGGGGRHLLFKYPSGRHIPCSNSRVAKGVDIKGDDGYVVSPPSNHESGTRYEYRESHDFDSVELAELPEWLLDKVVSEPPAQTEPGASIIESRRRYMPLGRMAWDFVSNGAPIGSQRTRALAATRNYLGAGYSIENTASKIWEGLKACECIASDPWTYKHAFDMAVDLSNNPRPSGNQSTGQNRKITFEDVEIRL
jgi:hypothetical protein